MTILHQDGFDEYAIAADLAMAYSISGSSFSTSDGRFGGGGVNINVMALSRAMPSAPSEIWAGVALLSSDSRTSNAYVFKITSASGIEGVIVYDPNTQVFSAYAGDYVTLLGVSSAITLIGAWHWIELHYLLSGSVGVVELWVDNTRVMNLTGVDNAHAGGSAITSFTLGANSGSLNPLNAVIDDLYILDPTTGTSTSRLGDSRIVTLVPTSDAGPNDGTPTTGGAGTHYTNVDEAQWSDANSLTITNTSGQAELFGMGSLGSSPPAIHSVRVLNVVEKTDAGTCNGESILKSGSTTVNGGSTGLLTAYGQVTGIFETDPNTSSAWGVSGVNAMSCGFEIP